jgi:hypothetical protein
MIMDQKRWTGKIANSTKTDVHLHSTDKQTDVVNGRIREKKKKFNSSRNYLQYSLQHAEQQGERVYGATERGGWENSDPAAMHGLHEERREGPHGSHMMYREMTYEPSTELGSSQFTVYLSSKRIVKYGRRRKMLLMFVYLS